MRIYPREADIYKIVEKSNELDPDPTQPRLTVDGVDINRLNRVLNSLDFSQSRKRRELYNRLFQEALIIQEPGRGISFTNMLLLLAHYKIIDDENALKYVIVQERTLGNATDDGIEGSMRYFVGVPRNRTSPIVSTSTASDRCCA